MVPNYSSKELLFTHSLMASSPQNWQVCAIRVPNAIKSQIASWEDTASNHTNSVLGKVWTLPPNIIFNFGDSEFSVFLLSSHCHHVNISLIARLSRKIKNMHCIRSSACSRGSSTEKCMLSGIVWELYGQRAAMKLKTAEWQSSMLKQQLKKAQESDACWFSAGL